nr:hypothetical protein [Tanacetum cinerariifolium]
MILESVEHGPLIWPIIEENRVIKTKKYAEFFAAEKIQADCDIKATNIILQGFAVPIFSPRDDLIVCLNKQMDFLIDVDSSRFPSTNNQLRASSNPRNKATIQDGKVTVQQVQGRQGQSYFGEGHTARQCTQLKRPRNVAWYKEKAMLAEAQEAGQILDEEQLVFFTDPGVPDSQAVQIIIPNNAAFL